MNTEGTAKSTELIDNPRVRVTRWDFERRDDNTGWHRHEYDYVVVPLMDGKLRIDEGDGKFSNPQFRAGEPYYRPKGVEHDVISDNDSGYSFIEVELKDPSA